MTSPGSVNRDPNNTFTLPSNVSFFFFYFSSLILLGVLKMGWVTLFALSLFGTSVVGHHKTAVDVGV